MSGHLLYPKTYIHPQLTKVGIVYSTYSGHVRRHEYPEHGDVGFKHVNLVPGEAICFVPIEHHHAGHDVFHASIRNAVQQHSGKAAVLGHTDPGARIFAHIDYDKGVVDNLVMACPDVDSPYWQYDSLGRCEYVEVTDVKDQTGGMPLVGHLYDYKTKAFTHPRPPLTKTQRGMIQQQDGSWSWPANMTAAEIARRTAL